MRGHSAARREPNPVILSEAIVIILSEAIVVILSEAIVVILSEALDVILSEAKNPLLLRRLQLATKNGFFASLRMTV